MARTYTLSDGTTTINLLDTTGFQARSFGKRSMTPDVNKPAGHMQFVETYELILYSSDQNDAAAQLQTLFKLLRKAQLYHTVSWQNEPVYITAQTDRESNARYALVYGTPSIGTPDLFAIPFATGDRIETVDVTLVRGIWRSGKPGATPTAATLTKTDASANSTKVVVANQYTPATMAFLSRSGSTSFRYATDTPGLAAWYVDTDAVASTDARGKLIVWASTDPAYTAVVDIETVGVFTSPEWQPQHFTGSAWVDTPADSFTWYIETASSTDTFNSAFLQSTGVAVMNWLPGPGTDTGTYDYSEGSGAVYNVGLLASTDTLVTIQPVQSSDQIYTQGKPYIELSSDILKGDVPSMVEFRMHGMYGQTSSNATFGATSKIIVGAKSHNLTGFASHLNCGGTLPSTDWAVSYDTDTASVADASAPGGAHAACTFAASAQQMRVSFTGANLMDDYRGEYKAFLRAEQVGGTGGDISVALKIKLGSTNAEAPARLGDLVPLATYDKGWEIVDLGKFSIPFVEAADTDTLTGNIIFEVQAVQNTTSITAKFADLIFIPIDEWSMVFDDPISDNDLGSSALRGNRRLDYDSGVLRHGAGLSFKSGTNYLPGENWFYGGQPFSVEAGGQTRIYFLMGHYHSDLGWGEEPLMSTVAQSLVVELRSQALYLSLRGAD